MSELRNLARIHIAYISPLNPIPSGISDYTEALVMLLTEYFHITLYSDCDAPTNPQIAERFQVYPVLDLPKHHLQHDLRLYQLGNSPHHKNAFTVLRFLPGVVVLHEPFFHHGLYYSSPVQYRREVFYELGVPDQAWLSRIEQALQKDDRQQLLENPLIGRVVDTSLGIIVHSQTARHIVETYLAKSMTYQRAFPQVRIIPQLMEVPDSYEVKECRARLGLPQDSVVFGMAGHIHPVKEPDLALQAFASLQGSFPSALFLFIGEILRETGDLIARAKELGIAERVFLLGRMEPLERFHQALAACDIILNLRRTTIGETSAVALRAMALGKPIIVRNVGWFSELPDGTCMKIGPDDGVEKLAAVMRALADSADMRLQIGQEAQRYVQRECDPHRVARQYAEFLWDVYLSITSI